MRPSNPILMNALPATSSQTSVLLPTQFVVMASFQVISSNTGNAGTVQFQFSNDPDAVVNANGAKPVNWSNLGSPITITAGALNSIQFPQSSYAGYKFIQAVWTPSSGAGTITINGFTIGYA